MSAGVVFAQWPGRHAIPGRLTALDYALLGCISVLLHLCVWLGLHHPAPTVPHVSPPRVLELELVTAPRPVPVVAPPPPVAEPEPPRPAPAPAPIATPRPKPVEKPKPKPKPAPLPKPPAPLPPAVPAVSAPTTPSNAAPAPAAPAVAAPAEPPLVPASTRATSRRNPKPEYPPLARRRGWEGRVVLAVEVRADGTPGDIEVTTSSGREILDNAAVAAVRRWLFEPARRGDEAVASTLSLSVNFKLQD